MSVEFHDFSIKVNEALEETAIAYLHDAASELLNETIDNTNQGVKYKGKEATSLWKYVVDEREKKATVGSPEEAAYWEEFGTGEHALHGNGRKGWWVYVEGNDSPKSNQKYYTEKEAKQAAAGLRSQGLEAHATNGRKPNRPLHRAYAAKKATIIRMAKETFGERLK